MGLRRGGCSVCRIFGLFHLLFQCGKASGIQLDGNDIGVDSVYCFTDFVNAFLRNVGSSDNMYFSHGFFRVGEYSCAPLLSNTMVDPVLILCF